MSTRRQTLIAREIARYYRRLHHEAQRIRQKFGGLQREQPMQIAQEGEVDGVAFAPEGGASPQEHQQGRHMRATERAQRLQDHSKPKTSAAASGSALAAAAERNLAYHADRLDNAEQVYSSYLEQGAQMQVEKYLTENAIEAESVSGEQREQMLATYRDQIDERERGEGGMMEDGLGGFAARLERNNLGTRLARMSNREAVEFGEELAVAHKDEGVQPLNVSEEQAEERVDVTTPSISFQSGGEEEEEGDEFEL